MKHLHLALDWSGGGGDVGAGEVDTNLCGRDLVLVYMLCIKRRQCLAAAYHCVSHLTCQHVGSLFWFQNVLYPMVAGRVQNY